MFVATPTTVKVAVEASQLVRLTGLVTTLGRWLTVIVICAESIQPPGTVVRLTVYVVVTIGDAATGFVVVELKPAAGLHKNVPVD